jgi:hypothetical protein
VDLLTARELATVLWGLAKVQHRPDLIFLEVRGCGRRGA